MDRRRRKARKEEGKLTKVKVLEKFTEILGLKVLKTPPLSPRGKAVWKLVKDLDGIVCPLYSPAGFEICAQGPRTGILSGFLFNAVPWWSERDGCSFLERQVVNPVFGCKSLEEAWMKLDLLDSEKPKR